ncbi:hypothetical protein NDU88_001727 [Pleurodeles waltl]|uniref:Uncharacterized protein n=1 Tax=Pleurodeles waltl TaxID=8319 RepID=A0AAV7T150_PLEWA|nr:hypothetical protein NDU88_001727 [Pleurodeles waltl]
MSKQWHGRNAEELYYWEPAHVLSPMTAGDRGVLWAPGWDQTDIIGSGEERWRPGWGNVGTHWIQGLTRAERVVILEGRPRGAQEHAGVAGDPLFQWKEAGGSLRCLGPADRALWLDPLRGSLELPRRGYMFRACTGSPGWCCCPDPLRWWHADGYIQSHGTGHQSAPVGRALLSRYNL